MLPMVLEAEGEMRNCAWAANIFALTIGTLGAAMICRGLRMLAPGYRQADIDDTVLSMTYVELRLTCLIGAVILSVLGCMGQSLADQFDAREQERRTVPAAADN